MPRSTKPRKRYAGKYRDTHAIFVSRDELDRIQAFFVKVQIIVEEKLPRGTCDMQDVQKMRDMMNFASMLMWAGHCFDSEKFEKESGAAWKEFVEAFHSFYGRVLARGVYAATGDELNALRDGFEAAGTIIKEELDHEPKWCLKVWDYMKQLTQ